MEFFRDQFFVQFIEAETGLVGHGDVPVFDLQRGLDEIRPPGNVHRMDFQRHKVPGRRRHMDRRHTGDGAFRHVNGHLNAVFFGKIADLFRFQNTARRQYIGMDHGKRTALQQGQERFLEIHVFTRPDGSGCRVGKADILIGHLPGNRVFHPGEIEFFQSLRQFDAVFQRDMPQMIDSDRNLISGHGTTFRHVVLKIIQPGFGNMDPGKRVCGVEEVVCLPAHGAGINGPVRRTENGLFVFAHFFQKTERSGKCARHIHQQFDPQIHFQESISLLHTIGKRFPHITSAAFGIGIAVNPDLVTVLSAEELPHGHSPCFPRKVPQRDFDPAHATRLT